jgi:hypothetical protein
MLLPLLEVAEGQAGDFVPAKSAGEQESKQCPIAFALYLLAIRSLPERLRLFDGQPVAEPDSQLLHALYAPDSRRQVGAAQPAVRRLVRKTAHSPEAKVDGTGSEIPQLRVHSVPNDHGLVERQSRLGAIPLHEFVNDMPIAALSIGAR